MTHFNKRVANHVTRLFAGRVNPFALLTHTGRKSGRAYTIPVMLFPHRDGYAIVLTYGANVDWVHNVEAAGRAEAVRKGVHLHLVNPRIVSYRAVSDSVPLWLHPFVRLTGAHDAMVFSSPPQ